MGRGLDKITIKLFSEKPLKAIMFSTLIQLFTLFSGTFTIICPGTAYLPPYITEAGNPGPGTTEYLSSVCLIE